MYHINRHCLIEWLLLKSIRLRRTLDRETLYVYTKQRHVEKCQWKWKLSYSILLVHLNPNFKRPITGFIPTRDLLWTELHQNKAGDFSRPLKCRVLPTYNSFQEGCWRCEKSVPMAMCMKICALPLCEPGDLHLLQSLSGTLFIVLSLFLHLGTHLSSFI